MEYKWAGKVTINFVLETKEDVWEAIAEVEKAIGKQNIIKSKTSYWECADIKREEK